MTTNRKEDVEKKVLQVGDVSLEEGGRVWIPSETDGFEIVVVDEIPENSVIRYRSEKTKKTGVVNSNFVSPPLPPSTAVTSFGFFITSENGRMVEDEGLPLVESGLI